MSTRVAELTVDELKQIIHEAVEQKLSEMLGDPDEGLGYDHHFGHLGFDSDADKR